MSEAVGFLKGKSAIYLARTDGEHKQNSTGQHFWTRGYFVSTVVERDETAIREYIRNQEVEDKRADQRKMWKQPPKGSPNSVEFALERLRVSRFERLTR